MIAIPVIAVGVFNKRRLVKVLCFLLSTLFLWVGLFLGVIFGYDAWHSMPNPPPEAYVDMRQLGVAIIFGWIPAMCATFMISYGIKVVRGLRKHAKG